MAIHFALGAVYILGVMRTWFITGAVRGLGASIAERALELGDSVVVATVGNPAHVRAALGTHEQLLVLPLDSTHEANARVAVAAALRRFGRIDVLVNNASYGLLGAIEEASASEVERVFRANVFGLLNVTRAVLPHLREQRSGHIVNISAVGNQRAEAGWGIYCATKLAVEAISEALAKEGEPLGIHTTLVDSSHFREGFLSSSPLVRAAQRLDDYRLTVRPTRTFASMSGHEQESEPDKLADAILALVDATKPPRRLPLGTDMVRSMGSSLEPLMPEVEPWRSLVLSTDFVS